MMPFLPCQYYPSGFQMIKSAEIQNFKCFRKLAFADCRRINLIVGDNGSGKTALLESMFLALGKTTQLVARFRQQRGLDASFRGSSNKIAEALIDDLFYQLETKHPIQIETSGDEPQNRSFRLIKGASQDVLPLDDTNPNASFGYHFIWKNSAGKEFDLTPGFSGGTISFPETGEDSDSHFYYAANQTYSSTENADRFSELSRSKNERHFVELIRKEYPWIENINVESVAGQPSLYVSIAESSARIPLSNISGGINRVATILLAMASRPRSVLFIDELENGLYYTHHVSYWRSILEFVRRTDSQIFVTTHSLEWIRALSEAAEEDTDDVAFWRLERSNDGTPELLQFSGKSLRSAMMQGEDVRGGSE